MTYTQTLIKLSSVIRTIQNGISRNVSKNRRTESRDSLYRGYRTPRGLGQGHKEKPERRGALSTCKGILQSRGETKEDQDSRKGTTRKKRSSLSAPLFSFFVKCRITLFIIHAKPELLKLLPYIWRSEIVRG